MLAWLFPLVVQKPVPLGRLHGVHHRRPGGRVEVCPQPGDGEEVHLLPGHGGHQRATGFPGGSPQRYVIGNHTTLALTPVCLPMFDIHRTVRGHSPNNGTHTHVKTLQQLESIACCVRGQQRGELRYKWRM